MVSRLFLMDRITWASTQFHRQEFHNLNSLAPNEAVEFMAAIEAHCHFAHHGVNGGLKVRSKCGLAIAGVSEGQSDDFLHAWATSASKVVLEYVAIHSVPTSWRPYFKKDCISRSVKRWTNIISELLEFITEMPALTSWFFCGICRAATTEAIGCICHLRMQMSGQVGEQKRAMLLEMTQLASIHRAGRWQWEGQAVCGKDVAKYGRMYGTAMDFEAKSLTASVRFSKS